MRVMGLDEAGRGPVLGPMVVGAYTVAAELLGRVVAAGATDSKRLSPARRLAVAGPLSELGTADTISIPATRIDRGNLNALEEDAFVELLELRRPDRAVIDAPCNPAGIPAFVRRLRGRLSFRLELVVEPRADLHHPPCGAASIFAKVRRDRAVAELGAVGSGYPSDPVTIAWLRGLVERGEPFPPCVRTRWGTVRRLSQGRLL